MAKATRILAPRRAVRFGEWNPTVVGSILIGVLLNGLVLMNVSSYIQQIIIGIIIVLAVAFDTFAKSRRRKV